MAPHETPPPTAAGRFDFETAGEPLPLRVSQGLARISQALRSQAWQEAGARGLTPTQAQILVYLERRGRAGARLAEVALHLGVTAATASAAVTTLVGKGLIAKRAAGEDRRALALRLTARGRREAGRFEAAPEALLASVAELAPAQQEALLVALLGLIRALQEGGEISVSRMCLACRFFRPDVHPDPDRPHHCVFVDAPFGDRHLRVDCPDFQRAAPGPDRGR